MSIKAIFCDIGGVCLTNGWEVLSRKKAAEHFGLDFTRMEKYHQALFARLECAEMSLSAYLAEVVFDQPRPFGEEEFTQFMFGESKPHPYVLDLLKAIRQSRRYLLCALNNEPLELNDYRIRTFALDQCFNLFFSSCFLGVRKPDPGIYQIALQVTRQKPQETLFIDDRMENVLAAQAQHFCTIHLQDPGRLPQALQEAGILLPEGF